MSAGRGGLPTSYNVSKLRGLFEVQNHRLLAMGGGVRVAPLLIIPLTNIEGEVCGEPCHWLSAEFAYRFLYLAKMTAAKPNWLNVTFVLF